MSINSVGFGGSLFGQAVQNLNTQLTNLSTQLATGEKSTTYAGMGVNEGFAIAARSQLANISAFTDTMTNINTNIGVANTALQAMVDIGSTVQTGANNSPQTLNSAGQTIAQQTASAQLSSVIGSPSAGSVCVGTSEIVICGSSERRHGVRIRGAG